LNALLAPFLLAFDHADAEQDVDLRELTLTENPDAVSMSPFSG
jgi:hypothetical protein